MKIGTVEKVKGSWCVFTTEDRKKFYSAKRYHRLRGVIWIIDTTWFRKHGEVKEAEFYIQKDARLHLKDMVEKGEVDLGEVYTYCGNLRETIEKVDYKSLYEKYFMETRKLKDEVIEWEHIAKERQKMVKDLLTSTKSLAAAIFSLLPKS